MTDKSAEEFASLRRLVVERPREARALIDSLLDTRPLHLESLLLRIGAPSESRLRQAIANSVRITPSRRDAVPQLAAWLSSETDEFTKAALRTAVAAEARTASEKRDVRPVDPLYVEAYRYAAGRLTHRVRNAITEPQAALHRLARLIEEAPDGDFRGELALLVAGVRDGLRAVSRVVEFETDDRYFTLRSLQIMDWLTTMNTEYAQKFSSIELTLDASSEVATCRVLASDYYLTTIFWNLWINSHQAVSGRCRITVHASMASAGLQLLLVDNGDGFSHEAEDQAFVSQYSSKDRSRGRGLLEVQDAVEQLRGDVRLVSHNGALRVRLMLPVIVEKLS